MEIQYIYTKKRSEFGRQCNFADRAAELHIDIPRDDKLAENFISKDPVDRAIQCAKEMSEHEINTERLVSETRGINHTEGGWPKDVNCQEPDQVVRFRKKVEKDENYTVILQSLGAVVEHCIKQNNAIDIFEDYFENIEQEASEEPPSAKVVNVFRDINEHKRSATHISWFPDGPTKLAVAYCNTDFQVDGPDVCIDSYIWDVANTNTPDMVMKPSSPLVSIEFNPKDTHTLIGGCYNGQLAFWDRRKGSVPVDSSPVEKSHSDPVWKVIWIQSKTGTEFFSTSTDGKVLWWDVRKLTEPTDILYLDMTKEQNNICAVGAYSLEYESTLPTKFMAGSEQGQIFLCNRKGKNAAEKVTNVFPGHAGPVLAIQRNPFYPKNFLSAGGWDVRIWSEEMREEPIMWTPYQTSAITDAAWSPARPGVFFCTFKSGELQIWDLTFKQKAPTLAINVFDEIAHSLRVQEDGQLVACGSHSGDVAILELSEGFYLMNKTEKNNIGMMFDRETHREKILEARQRELKLKEKAKAAAAAADGGAEGGEDGAKAEGGGGAAAGEDTPLTPEELIKKAEEDFFQMIEQERKEREKQNAERHRKAQARDTEAEQTQEGGATDEVAENAAD
uniref:Dynein intermediate chain 3, ciliary n=1 Tax=Schistocephalus solidus TaxID=70667 RepID=A0A0V0J856_SCHSO